MPTVLVVEDEPDMRFLLRLALERGQFDVQEAATGEAALEQMAADEPDLVLLDLNLPGMSGFDVLDRMREKGTLDRICVLMLTADARPGLTEIAEEKGSSGFLSKPVPPPELIARVSGGIEAKGRG